MPYFKVIGLVAGDLIGTATEYCTSYAYGPTKSIAMAGKYSYNPDNSDNTHNLDKADTLITLVKHVTNLPG
jgi:hypothetical protein